MTGREKIEQAFSPDGAPAFGAVICYEGLFVRDHWAEVTDQPWWVMSAPDLDAHVAFYRDRIERIGQDWFSLPVGMSREDRLRARIVHRPDGVYRLDRRTGEAALLEPPRVAGWRPEAGCHSPHPQDPPLTREALDGRIPLPGPSFPEGADELPRRILQGPGRDLFPIGAVASALWNAYSLWGFEGMMAMFHDRPDLVDYACARRVECARRNAARLASIGVRGVWIEECMTDMISPAAFRRFNLPYMRQIIEAIRDAGMLSIYYYCGNPNDRWDLLLEVGADALSLEESKKGFRIDIDEVVDIVAGRCVVLGNLDAIDLLRRGSDAAVRDEIARQLRAGRRNRGRFVMSLGSPVTPETPLSRVRLYTDIVHNLSPAP